MFKDKGKSVSILRISGKIILAVSAFVLLKILLGLLIPFSPGFSALPPEESDFLFPAMLIEATGMSLILLYFCRVSFLPGKKLILRLVSAYVVVNTILIQMETAYFAEAFPAIAEGDIGKLFLSGILHGMLYVSAGVIVFRHGAVEKVEAEADFTVERRWWKYVLSAFIYLVLYLVFGLIAQTAASLKEEYAEGVVDPLKTQLLPVFQLIRGAGFAWVAALIFGMFKKRSSAIIAASLMLSFGISLPLFSPSPIMAPALRIVHFVEISLSMLLFGLFSGLILTKKKGE